MNQFLNRDGKKHVIALIDGPNMSNLGARNKRVYGKINSIEDLQQYVVDTGKSMGVEVLTLVSNYEGQILEYIHETTDKVDGYIINPAGLTTTGEAVRHALEESGKPVVEVHFSNISSPPTNPRGLPGGPWESKFTRSATGLCMGLRQYSYISALVGLVFSLDDEEFLGCER